MRKTHHVLRITSYASRREETWNACGEAFDRFTTAADSFSDNIERPSSNG